MLGTGIIFRIFRNDRTVNGIFHGNADGSARVQRPCQPDLLSAPQPDIVCRIALSPIVVVNKGIVFHIEAGSAIHEDAAACIRSPVACDDAALHVIYTAIGDINAAALFRLPGGDGAPGLVEGAGIIDSAAFLGFSAKDPAVFQVEGSSGIDGCTAAL